MRPGHYPPRYDRLGLKNVIDFYDPTPGLPADPEVNDAYIASDTANGWVENNIYTWDGVVWMETVPSDGSGIITSTVVYIEATYVPYKFSPLPIGWEPVAVADHQLLMGLSGGNSTERYHLLSAEHTALRGGIAQDADVYHSHGRIHSPVADETALAAISGTVGEKYVDQQVVFVESLGMFHYDAESAAVPAVGEVVKPNDVVLPAPGRWVRHTTLTASDIALLSRLDDIVAASGATLIGYYNTTAQLVATTAQAALDEIVERIRLAHTPVADETALAAISGTAGEKYTANQLCLSLATGLYFFSAASMAVPAAGSVVKPGDIDIANPGRWIRITETSALLTVLLDGTRTMTAALPVTLGGLGTTPTAGVNLQNSTAAANGAQQVSPGDIKLGRGWATTSGTSKTVEFIDYVLPVQGTTAPTGTWVLAARIDGGAWANVITAASGGNCSFTGNVMARSSIIGIGSYMAGFLNDCLTNTLYGLATSVPLGLGGAITSAPGATAVKIGHITGFSSAHGGTRVTEFMNGTESVGFVESVGTRDYGAGKDREGYGTCQTTDLATPVSVHIHNIPANVSTVYWAELVGTKSSGDVTGSCSLKFKARRDGAAAPVAVGSLRLSDKDTEDATWGNLAGNLVQVDLGKSLGDATTRFDITKAGNTVRYTYDGTGTDPLLAQYLKYGSTVIINAADFNAANNGTFAVTAVGPITSGAGQYFEVTNAAGVAENDKTIGAGSIVCCTAAIQPQGKAGTTIDWTIKFHSINNTASA